MIRQLLATALLLGLSGAAHAQTAPQLPPPEKTDPVALQLMQGFPPPPDKVITLGTVLKPPNGRWAFHHFRELGPTVAVWRGAGGPSALKSAPRDLDAIAFDDDKAARTTLADWQKNTFTDGLLVMHKGAVVYERYYSGMQAHVPHVLWSMTKSFTGLLAALAVHEGRLDAKAKISHYLPELAEFRLG